MIQRYFLQCSYKGTPFKGWQLQPNVPTVQEAIEKALSTFLRKKIQILGAGRTDTGVHARKYFAHFDIEGGLANPEDLTYHLNKILPYEIAIQEIFPVNNSAHARFDAISRSYEYIISTQKDSFGKDMSWLISIPLDIAGMNEACKYLFSNTDFTSFCKLHSDNKTNICHIYEAYWKAEGNKVIFNIKADRFLRNMVRAIVGTMVDIGLGKIKPEDLETIIQAKDRNKASTSAPAWGLYFIDAAYPENLRLEK